jgi:hypothetical protein
MIRNRLTGLLRGPTLGWNASAVICCRNRTCGRNISVRSLPSGPRLEPLSRAIPAHYPAPPSLSSAVFERDSATAAERIIKNVPDQFPIAVQRPSISVPSALTLPS